MSKTIKLEKAIEILIEWDILSANEIDLDLRNAVALGIEALKRIQAERYLYPVTMSNLLPGETKD